MRGSPKERTRASICTLFFFFTTFERVTLMDRTTARRDRRPSVNGDSRGHRGLLHRHDHHDHHSLHDHPVPRGGNDKKPVSSIDKEQKLKAKGRLRLFMQTWYVDGESDVQRVKEKLPKAEWQNGEMVRQYFTQVVATVKLPGDGKIRLSSPERYQPGIVVKEGHLSTFGELRKSKGMGQRTTIFLGELARRNVRLDDDQQVAVVATVQGLSFFYCPEGGKVEVQKNLKLKDVVERFRLPDSITVE